MRARIHGAAADGGTRIEFESGGRSVAILGSAELFSPAGVRVDGVDSLVDRTPIDCGPFRITPFVADQDGSDAYAILVEADGAAAFYVGDLRSGVVQKLLHGAPPRVDVLLIEGTTIGKAGSSDGFPTEADFEEKFVSLFRQTRGLALVWSSGQNVDRIVTVYRACLRTSRQFIVDAHTADVLRTAHVPPIRRGGWEQIKVFRPGGSRRAASPPPTQGPPPIRSDQLAAAASQSAMVFRPGLMRDLERGRCLSGARLIFSLWSGYLEYENANPVLEWLDRHRIPLDQCHTSGHAGLMELVRLRDALRPAAVVPIGVRQPERFAEMFGRIERLPDGEWSNIPVGVSA